MATFSKTGVAAGTANFFQVFKMPAANATRDMKAMYGNIQRVMKTAASMPSVDCFKPLAITHTSQGAAATPRAEVMSKTQKRRVATRSIR